MLWSYENNFCAQRKRASKLSDFISKIILICIPKMN